MHSFIFAFYVVNIVLDFSYHDQNFRIQVTFFRSIQKIRIVAVDAYRHVKITFYHKVIKTIKQK